MSNWGGFSLEEWHQMLEITLPPAPFFSQFPELKERRHQFKKQPPLCATPDHVVKTTPAEPPLSISPTHIACVQLQSPSTISRTLRHLLISNYLA
jgi:hypothetical protein